MLPLFIVALAVGGAAMGYYIHYKRKTRGAMVCMIGENCFDVLDSKYSIIVPGIHNEILGILYFLGVMLYYSLSFSFPVLLETPWSTYALFATWGASAYSLFLIGIQAFIIRAWCEKCLFLSAFSFAVAIAVTYLYFL